MSKKEYIEKYGYISNNEFKIALSISKQYGINIHDWNLPIYQKLNSNNIELMIQLRLHLKYNCISKFKDNFYRMDVLPKNRGVEVINYTGHTLAFNGNKFSGDYGFCIHKKRNPINIINEKLYFIDGMYPIFSVTSCLNEDIVRVKNTNPSWWKPVTKAIEIIPYQK